MARKIISYTKTPDDFQAAVSSTWLAQTFTTTQGFSITKIKFRAYIRDTPNPSGHVHIRATDGDGLPAGENLTSGTFTSTDITADTDGEWVEVSVTKYKLMANTKYALIVRIQAGG